MLGRHRKQTLSGSEGETPEGLAKWLDDSFEASKKRAEARMVEPNHPALDNHKRKWGRK